VGCLGKVEEGYREVQDSPRAVAVNGGEWKEADTNALDHSSVQVPRGRVEQMDGENNGISIQICGFYI
jgi:hypothetical protein